MTYAALTAELDNLLRELERDDLPLDNLTHHVQRCYALIAEGRQHLRAAETALALVVEEAATSEAAFGPGDDNDDDNDDNDDNDDDAEDGTSAASAPANP